MDENIFKNQQSENQEKLDIKVRIATEKDLEDYKKIRLSALESKDGKMLGVTPEVIKKVKEKSDEKWKEDLISESEFVVLSYNGSQVVGMGIAVEDHKKIWRMRAQYVEKELRNNDIGKKISALRIQEIIKRGGEKVRLGVKADNKTSIHIAESFGFKKVEEGSSDEGFYMELDLTDPVVLKKIKDI